MVKICAYFEIKLIDLCAIEIFHHKNADFVAPLLGNLCCHGKHFVPHSWGGPHVSFLV